MAIDLRGQTGQQVAVEPDCADALVFDGTTKTFRCGGEVDGVTVPFDVTIGGSADPLYTMKITQLQGLILASAVLDAWAEDYAGSSEKLSCDGAIPEVAVVPFGKDTGLRCAAGTRIQTLRVTDSGYLF
ncbi:hypothetical protein [Rugosimonospora acidiphila]